MFPSSKTGARNSSGGRVSLLNEEPAPEMRQWSVLAAASCSSAASSPKTQSLLHIVTYTSQDAAGPYTFLTPGPALSMEQGRQSTFSGHFQGLRCAYGQRPSVLTHPIAINHVYDPSSLVSGSVKVRHTAVHVNTAPVRINPGWRRNRGDILAALESLMVAPRPSQPPVTRRATPRSIQAKSLCPAPTLPAKRSSCARTT